MKHKHKRSKSEKKYRQKATCSKSTQQKYAFTIQKIDGKVGHNKPGSPILLQQYTRVNNNQETMVQNNVFLEEGGKQCT